AESLPVELFHHLPEWCVYIEAEKDDLHGAWVHLEYDHRTGREELRLLLDLRDPPLTVPAPFVGTLQPVPIPLIGTLAEALDAVVAGTQAGIVKRGLSPNEARAMVKSLEKLRPLVEPVISLVLYLCSSNAEFGRGGDLSRRPSRPAQRIDK